MPSTRKHSNWLALLFLSIATLLVACSPTSQTPISTPAAHSTVESILSRTAPPIATLIPGNGGGTGRIALACSSNSPHDKADICVSNLDGSAIQRLTGGPGPNISPTWSPDGKHILFNSGRDGSIPLLYMINPDGSGIKRLCPHSHLWEEYPDWSPDGTKIAFMSNVGYSSWFINVMNVDCSGLKQITQGPGEDGGPRWSPDGKKIAFTSNRTGRAEVYVMNADGSQQTRLTTSSKDTSFN